LIMETKMKFRESLHGAVLRRIVGGWKDMAQFGSEVLC